MDLIAVGKLAGLFRPGCIGIIRVGGDYLNLLLFIFIAGTFFDDLAFARPPAGSDDGGVHDGSLFDDQTVLFKLLAQHVEKLYVQPPVQKMVAGTGKWWWSPACRNQTTCRQSGERICGRPGRRPSPDR